MNVNKDEAMKYLVVSMWIFLIMVLTVWSGALFFYNHPIAASLFLIVACLAALGFEMKAS